MSLNLHVVFLVCLLAWNCGGSANKGCLDVQKEIQDLKNIFHEEISNLKNEFNEKISVLKMTVENQETEIKRLKIQNSSNDQIQELTSQSMKERKRLLLDGTAQTDKQQFAFYAHLSHNIDNLGIHQPIVFDKVRTNQGNAYKAVDGEFVASVAGTYYFIWTISNSDNTYMISEIVVNGVSYGQIISDAAQHTDWAVSTSFAIVQLNFDDRVWIRAATPGHVSGVGYGTSSFAGFILW